MTLNYLKIGFVFFISLIFLQVASACMDIPTISLKNNSECSIFATEIFIFKGVVIQGGEFNSENFSDDFAKCNLSDEDILILKNFSQKRMYVQEQTNEEYVAFLAKSNRQKFNIFKKDRVVSVTREGRWTGYLKKNTRRFFSRSKC